MWTSSVRRGYEPAVGRVIDAWPMDSGTAGASGALSSQKVRVPPGRMAPGSGLAPPGRAPLIFAVIAIGSPKTAGESLNDSVAAVLAWPMGCVSETGPAALKPASPAKLAVTT